VRTIFRRYLELGSMGARAIAANVAALRRVLAPREVKMDK